MCRQCQREHRTQVHKEHSPQFKQAQQDELELTEASERIDASNARLEKWAEEHGIDSATKKVAQRESALRIVGKTLGYDFSRWQNGAGAHILSPAERADAHAAALSAFCAVAADSRT